MINLPEPPRQSADWSRRRVALSVIGLPVLGLALAPRAVTAGTPVFETFENLPDTRWDYVADTVMGGVSTGQVTFEDEAGTSFARLTGRVSTVNNGGFIQFRRRLSAPPPAGITGVRLIQRGNDQRYFVHLRTKGTRLPWQYYQAGFDAGRTWSELRLPLTAFQPSGNLLRKTPKAEAITSVGIVAFGRDHDARVDVSEVDFY